MYPRLEAFPFSTLNISHHTLMARKFLQENKLITFWRFLFIYDFLFFSPALTFAFLIMTCLVWVCLGSSVLKYLFPSSGSRNVRPQFPQLHVSSFSLAPFLLGLL